MLTNGLTMRSPSLIAAAGGVCGWSFRDNFSGADNWNDIGNCYGVNTSTNVFDFDSDQDGSNNGSDINMPCVTISDTTWLLRFRLCLGIAVDTRTSSSAQLMVGVWSCDRNRAGDLTQDGIYWKGRIDGTAGTYRSIVTICNGIPVNESGSVLSGVTPSTDDNHYWELQRITSTTAAIEVFDNSNFVCCSLAQDCEATDACVTGLTYTRIFGSVGCDATARLAGEMDTFEFNNGTTCPP